MAISHCYWHLLVKNGNFSLLLTSSGQEWQLADLPPPPWVGHRMAIEYCYTKLGRSTSRSTPQMQSLHRCLEYHWQPKLPDLLADLTPPFNWAEMPCKTATRNLTGLLADLPPQSITHWHQCQYHHTNQLADLHPRGNWAALNLPGLKFARSTGIFTPSIKHRCLTAATPNLADLCPRELLHDKRPFTPWVVTSSIEQLDLLLNNLAYLVKNATIEWQISYRFMYSMI